MNSVFAERAQIKNEFLVITSVDGVLTVQSRETGKCFVPEAVFPGGVEKQEVKTAADPVWGKGRKLAITQKNGWMTEVCLYPDQPFAHVRTIAHNRTEKTVSMKRAVIMSYCLDLGIPLEKVRVLGTGGLSGVPALGSYAFSAVVDPETRSGAVSGWLTHERSVGVFLPNESKGKTDVTAQVEFGRFTLRSGQTRSVDTMLLGWFSDARLGLEAYADAVAAQYDIRLKPLPSVYCTWYHAGASNEKLLLENTAFAAEHLKPFGLNVMQIDDRWQALLPEGFEHKGTIKTTGPVKVFVDAKNNYPHGMAFTAEKIASQGMIPGIWFMPFAGNFRNPYFDPDIFARNPDGTPFHDSRWSGTCIDVSNPKAQAFLRQRVKRIYGWGYRYFKLDGMHTGAPSYNIYVQTKYRHDAFPESRLQDPGMTHVQAYRKGLEIVRETAPDAFILGCNVSQNMVSMGPAFGLIDAMRIGPDNGSAGRGNWGGVTAGAWHNSTLYFLNGRVWHNDPDPVYVRPGNPLHKARLMCSYVVLSGAMLTTSYQFSKLPPERLELLKRSLPGHGLPGRPVDLFERIPPRIWILTDTRRTVRRDVIGLFNWDEKQPVEIACDAETLGLESASAYHVFDFWNNTFLDPMQEKLKVTVPPGSCRILAVRPEGDCPQLVSTSRHIAQCIVDVLEEKWDAQKRLLHGKSHVVAGDRYELRIALPEKGKWTAMHAVFGKQKGSVSAKTKREIRVAFIPETTGAVTWRVQF